MTLEHTQVPQREGRPEAEASNSSQTVDEGQQWQNANACTHSRDIIWLCQSALDLPPSTSPIPISKDYWKYLLPTKYRDSMARLIRSASHLSDDTYRFLGYLDLATNTSQETAIVDFARELLRVVGFEERGRILRTRHTIPLSICGENNTVAQTDVCLMDRRSTILLVLQDDKTIFNPSDPEPQVIAEAIAAYQHNNQRRNRMGLPTLNTMTVPCITMVGTRPTFYLVPVTRELSDAVITGQWPEVETKV
ncbi:hypothetical protein BGY98DRAFT_946046 [Russula aff. rugulosa BPL654]|nr:hypothetical protein BGY98DRAFT_946046 [Russula aff. rugulosa BPL654]